MGHGKVGISRTKFLMCNRSRGAPLRDHFFDLDIAHLVFLIRLISANDVDFLFLKNMYTKSL